MINMNPIPPITAALLEAHDACEPQVTLFRQHFREGSAPLDDDTAQQLGALFDAEWAAVALLPYELREAYEKARAPLLDAYRKARAPLLDAYKKAEASLWDAYGKAEAPLLDAYKKAKALAFVRIYRENMQ